MSDTRTTDIAHRLPDFPWDQLEPATKIASQHPQGIIKLSVGSPIDPVPPVISTAVTAGLAIPGYPQVKGIPGLRQAISESLTRRFSVGFSTEDSSIVPLSPDHILPVIGTKEFIAHICSDLGLSSEHTVFIPEIAYPTYEVSALISQSSYTRADWGNFPVEQTPSLIFINSPSNPTGKVLGVEELREIVLYAQSCNAIVVSDECYLGLPWETTTHSILDPAVHQGNITGLLAVHSTSKTSNMASYRSGYVAGDPDIIASLTELRRHSGMMMPHIIQLATLAAVNDDNHIRVQREIYANRRTMLKDSLERIGFRCEHSQAGLYLWVTRDTDCMEEVNFFAHHGIIVAPGKFYGPQGNNHIRVGLTASNEHIAQVAHRLLHS